MGENLINIVGYIDASVDFSGCIWIEEIEDLFRVYPVMDEEKVLVFNKLEQLNVNIVYSDEIFKEKLLKLYNNISSNGEIQNSRVREWAIEENISKCMEERVLQGLANCGYKITIDTYSGKDLNKVV